MGRAVQRDHRIPIEFEKPFDFRNDAGSFVIALVEQTAHRAGDNWMQKQRTGSYIADDYADTRLAMYDDLFAHWETLLKFQIQGKDHDGPLVVEAADKKP